MIGVGAVLAAIGVYMVASVAMDYVIMALLGAPAVVFGLAILIYISEWRLMMLGCVVAAVGAFFAFAGVYMTVTSAPMAVMLTVVGSVTIVLQFDQAGHRMTSLLREFTLYRDRCCRRSINITRRRWMPVATSAG